MADVTDQHDQTSPNDLDESNITVTESRGTKRQRSSAVDDDDDDDEKGGRERRKIDIKFISDKSRRHITFSKRKAGIMKKAYELSVLTGTQVLLLVVSETGLVYTFTTPKLQPLVTRPEGKNLIQACLNAPEPASAGDNGVDEPSQGGDSPDESTGANHMAPQQNRGLPQGSHMAPQGYIPNVPMDPNQAMAYSNYVQRNPQYTMPQHSGHQA